MEIDTGKVGFQARADLLKDFPNLEVGGGLLPNPEIPSSVEAVYETQEWTVIVFLHGEGHGKKMICPNPVYNSPPKEGDWARHPCYGMVCMMRSAPLWKITDC